MKKLLYILGAMALLGFVGCDNDNPDLVGRDDNEKNNNGNGNGNGNGNENNPPDIIFDFANYSIYISVIDSNTGADLLDPTTEYNILGNEIKAIYDRKSYPRWTVESLTANRPEDVTRDTKPLDLGLRWGRLTIEWTSPYYLGFGEFAPEGYHDEPFVIDWGDGTQTEFRFDCYTTWEDPTDPDVHRRLWVDGVEHEGTEWIVEIRKQGKELTEIDLAIQRAEVQMTEVLERCGDYDTARVEELLCGKDFHQWAYMEYDSSWTTITGPHYVFGEWISVGAGSDGYRFEADGTMTWFPGEPCDPSEEIEPANGSWEFDPATKTLTINYNENDSSQTYTLIALDETTVAWDLERVVYENGSESFREYLRSVYIVH